MSEKRILHLPVKKKFFDMEEAGIKTEDYREIKAYWSNRLLITNMVEDPLENNFIVCEYVQFDEVHLRNGYGKNAPLLIFEWKGTDIGPAVPEWSDNWQGNVFRIKLGKRLN
jgi:hypothetical protein